MQLERTRQVPQVPLLKSRQILIDRHTDSHFTPPINQDSANAGGLRERTEPDLVGAFYLGDATGARAWAHGRPARSPALSLRVFGNGGLVTCKTGAVFWGSHTEYCGQRWGREEGEKRVHNWH